MLTGEKNPADAVRTVLIDEFLKKAAVVVSTQTKWVYLVQFLTLRTDIFFTPILDLGCHYVNAGVR